MVNLRPYQLRGIQDLRESFRKGHRSPLYVAPPGAGKTVMFSFFASNSRGQVLILSHRPELIDQISTTLNVFGVEHSFVAAGRHYWQGNRVHIASVPTLLRREIPAPDLIVVDECHHAVSISWRTVLSRWPGALKVGVTATPCRLGGEALGDIFDNLILGPSVSELIRGGYLTDYRIFAPHTIDTSELPIRGGDYPKESLASVADKPTITGNAVREYTARCGGKRTIVYCVSIEHARHVAEEFKAHGYQAASLDGSLSRDDRASRVANFRSGAIQVLSSVDLVGEGFDLPAIEVMISLRPTASEGLWIQQMGRALRPYPGKQQALILDHAGNTARHGLPDDDREWTLTGRRGRAVAAGVGVRICLCCFRAQPSGSQVCVDCQAPFPVEPRELQEKEGDLQEIDREHLRRTRKREEGMARTLDELIQLGRARGYNPKWAYIRYQARPHK